MQVVQCHHQLLQPPPAVHVMHTYKTHTKTRHSSIKQDTCRMLDIPRDYTALLQRDYVARSSAHNPPPAPSKHARIALVLLHASPCYPLSIEALSCARCPAGSAPCGIFAGVCSFAFACRTRQHHVGVHMCEEWASVSKLHHQVEVSVIQEDVLELNDVRVPQSMANAQPGVCGGGTGVYGGCGVWCAVHNKCPDARQQDNCNTHTVHTWSSCLCVRLHPSAEENAVCLLHLLAGGSHSSETHSRGSSCASCFALLSVRCVRRTRLMATAQLFVLVSV